MANNPYVNKVQKADGTTIIDISDTTATASEILQGYGAYGADGAWMDGTASGGSSGIVYITDEEDEHGGIVRRLTTDGATITDTTDAHGGTVRSITGAEVYLQSRNVTPTEAEQTITPTGDYNALGLVKVGAIPSDYIGSAIEERDSSDLTVSGATVNVPAGVYGSAASKSVSSGTEGTPTATKGAVSNHSVTITPSVTNSAGYINGGTKTGTGISVAASELVSGTLYCDDAGNWDVTNAETFVVGSGTVNNPVATKSAVSNHAITVTPSVTATSGYIAGGTKTGTGVSVSASELVSGSETKTQNGTYDVTNLASLVVNVSGGSPTLITKNITANGTYNASSDNADGYSSVTVNVSGGATNAVMGTFTTNSSGVQNITLPYSGSGYPISLNLFVTAGAMNSSVTSVLHCGAVLMLLMVKADTTAAPSYRGDEGCTRAAYKSSTTSASSMANANQNNTAVYSTTPLSNGPAVVAVFTSKTNLSVYVSQSSSSSVYGLLPNASYTYVVGYSS